MRRVDIIQAFSEINEALEKSHIAEAIQSAPKTKGGIEELLLIYQTYIEFNKNFSPAAKKVLKIFHLDRLENPKLWTTIIASTENEKRDQLLFVNRGYRYFIEFFPNIVELLKQDHVNYEIGKASQASELQEIHHKETLTIILPEQENEISSPERLIKILESVNLLYSSFAILQNTSDTDLSVAAMDSGSDKSFDFLGAAKLMTSIKELIIGLWDRVVFFRERRLSERLDLIAKSLPIIEKINELQEGEKISREQAEILRRNITTAANNFIVAGAVIPELSNHSTYDPRQIMAAEPKLLTNTTVEAQKHVESSDIDDTEISEEELEAMKKIIQKRRKKKE